MSENEQAMAEAAAAVTESFFGSPEPEGQVAVVEAPAPVEAATPVVEQPAAEAPVAETAAPVATFELNPKLPDDIAAELAEADIDAEVDEQVAAYEPETDEWGNPVEVDTDAVRERIRLQKRVEYLERQVVESKAANWKKESEQFFPLAKHALDDIAKTATSRRAFLRAAKAEHDRILPHVQGYLADAKEYVDGEVGAETAAARAQVAEAWGQPVTGPGSGEVDAAGYEQKIQAARKTGRLADVFAAMIRGPKA